MRLMTPQKRSTAEQVLKLLEHGVDEVEPHCADPKNHWQLSEKT
jgi:hypothetical protein